MKTLYHSVKAPQVKGNIVVFEMRIDSFYGYDWIVCLIQSKNSETLEIQNIYFRLTVGVPNAIKSYSRLKIRAVCGGIIIQKISVARANFGNINR
jgi:hypothetical protein